MMDARKHHAFLYRREAGRKNLRGNRILLKVSLCFNAQSEIGVAIMVAVDPRSDVPPVPISRVGSLPGRLLLVDMNLELIHIGSYVSATDLSRQRSLLDREQCRCEGIDAFSLQNAAGL